MSNYLENNFLDDKYMMKCPVCGYDYIHLEEIIESGDDLSKNGGYIIKMSCENGCLFDIAIVAHKGNIFRKFINKKTNAEQLD